MSLVNYLVGDTRGRDHQYWPTILRDEMRDIFATELFATDTDEQNRIFDANWPVAVNLAVLMQMAWRVREWKVEASSFAYTGIEAGVPTLNWHINGTLPELSLKMKRVKKPADMDDPLRDVTDEVDILGPASDKSLSFNEAITPAPGKWKSLRNAGVSGRARPEDIILTGSSSGFTLPFLVPPFIEPGGSYGAGMFGQYVIWDPDEELFYPPLGIGGRFERLIGSIGDTSGAAVEIYCLPQTPTAPDPETPKGALTITGLFGEPDISVPLGMLGRPAGIHPPFWGPGTGTVNLTMRPFKWWPYGGKWDEDTGGPA